MNSVSRNSLVVFLVLITTVLFCIPAESVIVILKNGRSLEGNIVFQDENQMFFALNRGGQIIIPAEEIESLIGLDIEKTATATATEGVPPTPTITPMIDLNSLRKPTSTPTGTPEPKGTPTPIRLRKIEYRLFDKQEHRTLLSRRFVYHIDIMEDLTDWETKHLLLKLLKRYCREEVYADAIKIRLYGQDSKNRRFDWPFAVADYAPYGNWEKSEANRPRNTYLVKLSIRNKTEFVRLQR